MSEGEGKQGVPWRIIGIGSPVAGDDLGWLAIDWLRNAGFDRDAELLTLDRPGPALIDYLQPDSRVILIDAMDAGLPAGSVRELALDGINVRASAPSSHDLGLAEALALARALGGLPRHLYVVGIQMGADGADGAGQEWRREACSALTTRVRGMMQVPVAVGTEAIS